MIRESVNWAGLSGRSPAASGDTGHYSVHLVGAGVICRQQAASPIGLLLCGDDWRAGHC